MADITGWVKDKIVNPVAAGATRTVAATADILGADRSAQGLYRQASNITDPTKTLNSGITISNGLPMVNEYAGSGGLPAQQPQAVKASGGATTQSTGGGVYTGGSGSGGSNAADIAAYQDNLTALQQLLSQADVSRNNGTQSIENSFNNQNARLNEAQSSTLSKYATQRGDTQSDYQKNLDRISSQARNGYNSLQALLGGTGSAGDVLAPFAVSQQASAQRGTSSDAYARNLRDLDSAEGDAKSQYKNAMDDLLGQKNDKMRSLISSIDAQKQNYLSQIGSTNNQLNIAKGGGYVTPAAQNNQIAQLIAEQNGLNSQFADPSYKVQAVNAQAPDLAQYNAQAAQLAGQDNQPDNGDDAASALAALLKQQQQQNLYSY